MNIISTTVVNKHANDIIIERTICDGKEGYSLAMNFKGEKETFGYVLKKRLALILVPVILIAMVTGASAISQHIKRNNENLHLLTPPVDLGLKPIDFLGTDGTDGNLGTVLTETAPVGSDYFIDTLFVGDSLTDGIRIYEAFAGVQAVSTKGINTHSALTHTFHPIDGQMVTMIDAIEYYKPRRVYMMLGTNGLNWETVEWNLAGYEVLVDEILRRVPGCYIVIQSLPPTTAERAIKTPAYSLENMAKYNEGLRDIAIRKGVYFLDVNAALSNAEGYLDTSIAASDGIHMGSNGYTIWYNYIITHAIQGESAFYISSDGLIMFTSPISTLEEPEGDKELAEELLGPDALDDDADDNSQETEPPPE